MKIALDAGHGGTDPGAVSGVEKEKVWTLKLAFEVEKYLKKLGHEVVMTRLHDVFVPLPTRCLIANRAKCDLFVSIHLNAGGGEGSEVLIYPGSRARPIAERVLKSLGRFFKIRGVKDRSDLAVLKGTEMPAVLIEVCFIDNKNDMAVLKSKFSSIAEEIAIAVAGKKEEPAKLYRVVLSTGTYPTRLQAEKAKAEIEKAVKRVASTYKINVVEVSGKN